MALVALALGGCEFEPFQPRDLEFSMAPANTAQLTNTWGEPVGSAAEAQILGALEMLAGTPQAPKYMLSESMIDDGWDPNLPTSEELGELSEQAIDEIYSENRARRFEFQLQLIEQGRFSEVPEPLYAADLWATWEADHLPGLLEDPDAPMDPEDPEWGTRKERAVALFVEHYPTLRETAEMYRTQCMHCHGVSGGGDGPTGEFLTPRPRDYRLGNFKWIKVDRNQRPRRDDLLHILRYGVPRTAMPSFARFSRGELEGMIDYVRLLSVRGEVESLMVSDTSNSDYGDVPYGSVFENYDLVWRRWLDGPATYKHFEGEVPRPEQMTAERIARGKELFEGNVANCYTCHGKDARGNGDSAFEDITYEDESGESVSLHRKKLDEWGQALEARSGRTLVTKAEIAPYASNPRNLRLGNYRGGGRPVDIYRRIKFGISGTIMPAADTSLSDDDLWNTVYYVLSIAQDHDVARIQERKAEAAHGAHHGPADQDDHSAEDHSTGEESH
jgi:mono/diheme cytochrome c family protein